MAIINEIASNQTARCGYLYIEDSSEYGQASPDLREDYGIAIFVNVDPGSGIFTNDQTLSDLSNAGANNIPGTWDIDIPNTLTQNYEIIAFWCPLWISNSYSENEIVFYDSLFYRKTAVGDGTEIPGVGTQWEELDIDNYDEFDNATNLLSDSIYESVIGCPPYKVILKECDHVHRIIDNSESSNSKRFYVTKYDGTSVIEETLFTAEYMDINLPQDHIYILTIEEEISQDTWVEVSKLPIYEYCSLKKCVTYLMNSILCNDWDPCCENCDSDAIKKKERQRLELNKIVFLYGSLLSYINEESIQYLGIYEMGVDRLTYMESIDNLFDKISSILQRCELCSGAWQTTTTNTTNSGSYKPCNC